MIIKTCIISMAVHAGDLLDHLLSKRPDGIIFKVLVLSGVSCLFFLLSSCGNEVSPAQPELVAVKDARVGKDDRSLFQYGIAESFVNGAYTGQLNVGQLKKHGTFGLGAPNSIDGELTLFDGKVYQTRANGHTRQAPDSLQTPFAFVTDFEPEGNYAVRDVNDLAGLFQLLSARISSPNRIYALRIHGKFEKMITRAFPAMDDRPVVPLADIMDRQQVFQYSEVSGSMIGFYMPPYLAGLNIKGLHFHFLSDDKTSGGHVIGLGASKLVVEWMPIDAFQLETSGIPGLERFHFQGENTGQLNKIEKGH